MNITPSLAPVGDHNADPQSFPIEALARISTPEELAGALLSDHRIVQKALPPMVERVLADDTMRDQVMARLIEAECRRVLEAEIQRRHQEHKRQTGGGPLGQARSSDMAAWAGAVQSALLDNFRLPNGKRLGDANRGDLSTALASYETVAADATIKHRWLRLIQQSVPNGKTVREVLNESRVAELREEARKGDA